MTTTPKVGRDLGSAMILLACSTGFMRCALRYSIYRKQNILHSPLATGESEVSTLDGLPGPHQHYSSSHHTSKVC